MIVLRRTNPGQPRPFRTPWVPFVPIMGILFNGYMMYKLGWINWARLIVWLLIGLVDLFRVQPESQPRAAERPHCSVAFDRRMIFRGAGAEP